MGHGHLRETGSARLAAIRLVKPWAAFTSAIQQVFGTKDRVRRTWPWISLYVGTDHLPIQRLSRLTHRNLRPVSQVASLPSYTFRILRFYRIGGFAPTAMSAVGAKRPIDHFCYRPKKTNLITSGAQSCRKQSRIRMTEKGRTDLPLSVERRKNFS